MSRWIRKILKHLGLWGVTRLPVRCTCLRAGAQHGQTQTGKPLPMANGPPDEDISTYDEPSAPSVDDCIIDPDYPAEAYF